VELQHVDMNRLSIVLVDSEVRKDGKLDDTTWDEWSN
jgi:hypothetical protein